MNDEIRGSRHRARRLARQLKLLNYGLPCFTVLKLAINCSPCLNRRGGRLYITAAATASCSSMIVVYFSAMYYPLYPPTPRPP